MIVCQPPFLHFYRKNQHHFLEWQAKKNANTWKEAEFIQTKGLGHSMNDEALFEKISSFITESK